jgi:hypothetical protein
MQDPNVKDSVTMELSWSAGTSQSINGFLPLSPWKPLRRQALSTRDLERQLRSGGVPSIRPVLLRETGISKLPREESG